MALRLRPYRLEDEAAAVAIHDSMLAEDFAFLLYWEPESISGPSFWPLSNDQRRGINADATIRCARLQFAAVVDGVLVGRASIRFELNEFFAARGGHIGYGVAPRFADGATRVRSSRRRW
jgi:hypothetical protein